MKKLFLMTLLLMAQSAKSYDKEYDSSEAIDLANKFITKLHQDTPFLYEDEVAYFGELTLYSYVILHKLKYVNEKGQWIKPKPKYSYLCELIRINSKFIFLKDPRQEYYFSGIPKLVTKNGLNDYLFYANIAYIQEEKASYDGLLVSNAKITIITYKIPRKKLDLPISVDGNPFQEHLGFIFDFRGVPELREKELDELIKHIFSLENH